MPEGSLEIEGKAIEQATGVLDPFMLLPFCSDDWTGEHFEVGARVLCERFLDEATAQALVHFASRLSLAAALADAQIFCSPAVPQAALSAAALLRYEVAPAPMGYQVAFDLIEVDAMSHWLGIPREDLIPPLRLIQLLDELQGEQCLELHLKAVDLSAAGRNLLFEAQSSLREGCRSQLTLLLDKLGADLEAGIAKGQAPAWLELSVQRHQREVHLGEGEAYCQELARGADWSALVERVSWLFIASEPSNEFRASLLPWALSAGEDPAAEQLLLLASFHGSFSSWAENSSKLPVGRALKSILMALRIQHPNWLEKAIERGRLLIEWGALELGLALIRRSIKESEGDTLVGVLGETLRAIYGYPTQAKVIPPEGIFWAHGEHEVPPELALLFDGIAASVYEPCITDDEAREVFFKEHIAPAFLYLESATSGTPSRRGIAREDESGPGLVLVLLSLLFFGLFLAGIGWWLRSGLS